MNRYELSNLAALIWLVASRPTTDTIEAAQKNMDFNSSPTFKKATSQVALLVKRIQKFPEKEQKIQLQVEVKKMIKSKNYIKNSVGRALDWAMNCE